MCQEQCVREQNASLCLTTSTLLLQQHGGLRKAPRAYIEGYLINLRQVSVAASPLIFRRRVIVRRVILEVVGCEKVQKKLQDSP